MNSEMEIQHPTTLIPFRDARIPGNLGNFQLDKHNVEEWSDTQDPTIKHRGRKETGKWIDLDRNADIHIQRQEDATKSAKGQENQRTEVIQGTSPDSLFQIVRTEREFKDSGSSGNTEDQNRSSMSTTSSYQMSSSRGMRFTSKTTSNKTTTTTVCSGGRADRSDDFENFKIPFHPLDTSTQRERINVGRSGTMGVRRPPTRKPPTTSSSHPEVESDMNKEVPITTSEEPPITNMAAGNETNELSPAAGYKNISPKILIGFPVEIQVELKTKLTRETGQDGKLAGFDQLPSLSLTSTMSPLFRKLNVPEDKTDLPSPPDSSSIFNNRRKSYGFESLLEAHKDVPILAFPKSNSPSTPPPVRSLTSIRNMKRFIGDENENISYMETFSPSGISRSWDLMQRLGIQPGIPPQDSNSKQWETFLTPETMDLPSNYASKKTVFSGSSGGEEEIDDSGLVSLSDCYTLDSTGKATSQKHTPPSHSQGLRKSFYDEEDDTIPNELSGSSKGISNWETEWEKTKIDLDRLNNVINSSQDEQSEPGDLARNTQPVTSGHSRNYSSEDKRNGTNGMGILSSGGQSIGRYGNVDPDAVSKISQTWISSSDFQKPSRHAQDKDLSTSISATTSDPSKRALKKVEFCKTEVHFTPEPGKFHIVESDENKPSTVHLFRRKKRKVSIDRGQTEDSENQEERNGAVLDENKVMLTDMEEQESKVESVTSFWADDSPRKFSRNYGWTQDAAITPMVNKSLQTSHLQEDSAEERFVGNGSYEDQNLPTTTTTTATDNPYEELKIQKYLKQLKPLPRSSFEPRDKSDRTFAHNQFIMNQVRADFGVEEPGDDEELQFRYGSFVPLATRQSLIEMNNRNRMMKRINSSTTNSQVSDNSSTTTSNYSLPHSEDTSGYEQKPSSRLMTLEGIFSGGGHVPRNTSTNLRYSIFDEKERRKDQRSSDQVQNYEKHSQIPEPVLPWGLRSMPPYRSGRRSFSSSPVRENANRFPKPPTPILPIQFSTFEKTGEGLRSRFLSKNPQCGCHHQSGKEKLSSSVADVQIPERRTLQLKTVVNIGNNEDSEEEHEIDLNAPKLNPVTRSMTFSSNSNRSEPEWVLKAKAKARNREIQGTEWMEIGQRHAANNNSETEPPWISELKTRNRGSPIPDEMGLGHTSASLIYPWQRNGDRKVFENEKVMENDEVLKHLQPPLAFHQYNPIGNNQYSEKSAPYKSLSVISTTTANNKSIVDLNRDFESITINPNQIELSPGSEEKLESKTISRKGLNSKDSAGNNSLRRTSSNRMSRIGNISPTKSSPFDLPAEKVRSTKTDKESDNQQSHSHHHHRKPLQTSTTVNQNQGISKENGELDPTGGRHKAKTVPKPPKPPQRISSLVNSQTVTTLNASLDKKKKASPTPRKVGGGEPVVLETSSTTSTLKIHRHPTLKVSKLPLKMSSTPSSSKPSSPEAKDPIKTKSHVSLMTEAKRLYKGKQSKFPSSGETIKSDGSLIRTRSPRNPDERTHVTSASPQQRKR